MELEHRDLENFGPDAEKMSATFNEPGAWTATLTTYRRGVGESEVRRLLHVGARGATNAPPHFPAHRARVDEFHARGELLLVGTFADPQAEGSMSVFRTREAAQEFVDGDPFVRNGVVASYEIREWNEVLMP